MRRKAAQRPATLPSKHMTMGGGGQHTDEQQRIASPPRPFRHRRTPSRPADSGLDVPPSVTFPSLGHTPCSLNIRTGQHLCTLVHPPCSDQEENIPAGTAPCDPVIAFGRYILSATDDGRVSFFSIHLRQEPCRPVVTVNVDPYSTLTGLVAVPSGVSLVCYRSTVNKERVLKPPDFLGHVVAISSEGDVHILECSKGGQAKVLFSWNTEVCDISCLTVRPDCSGQWRICLGYESGSLEEWQVSIPVRETREKEVAPAKDEGGTSRNKEAILSESLSPKEQWKPLMRRAFPQLIYRGFFGLPIRSMSSLGTAMHGDICQITNTEESPLIGDAQYPLSSERMSVQETKETAGAKPPAEEKAEPPATEAEAGTDKIPTRETKEEKPNVDVNDIRDYLSVCLVMNPRVSDESLGRPASSSQIEVVCVATLERDWNTLLEQEHTNTKDMALPLEEYCIWPQAGGEILDTSSLPANDDEGQCRLSRRIRGLPSQGSDRMCSCDGTSPFFVAAFSDGTIARMHATIEDSSLQWGVSNESDQVVLSYPAIGLATVSLSTGRYLACCLRGGTVYLVPESDSNTIKPILVILGHVDVGKEPSTHYLQGFTAGNVLVNGVKTAVSKNQNLAVLIYSSAGGVLKVNSCELLAQTEQDIILLELVHNGTAQLLQELLCSVDDDDGLLRSSDVWRGARRELIQAKDDALTAEMLNSSSFVHTRQVLIQLASEDANVGP